jgi:preprotein translocase subunit YajC
MNLAEITFITILVVLVAFYLVTIRPAQQEQKRQQQTIRDLQVGDEVVTTSGFFARVKEIHTPEEGPVQIVLELGTGLEVRALTSAIVSRVAAEQPAERTGEAKGA